MHHQQPEKIKFVGNFHYLINITKCLQNSERCTFEIRRTSMIRGKNFRLFVISTIMTHRDTVIRIEPPRKEAAPSSAYLAENPSTEASALMN